MWLKIIFLSQYLFIAILCAKMSSVNKALAVIFFSNKPIKVDFFSFLHFFLDPIFDTAKAASINTTCFKSGQK